MNKTKATHVLYLSQAEYETLLWALEEAKKTVQVYCDACGWSHAADGHLYDFRALEDLLDRLTETE